MDSENQRRTQLESDLKMNAQEIAALRSTEKQLAKVWNTGYSCCLPLEAVLQNRCFRCWLFFIWPTTVSWFVVKFLYFGVKALVGWALSPGIDSPWLTVRNLFLNWLLASRRSVGRKKAVGRCMHETQKVIAYSVYQMEMVYHHPTPTAVLFSLFTVVVGTESINSIVL